MAPVYDTLKKRRFADEYRAARGKYDVYGLFMERALQILKPGGCFSLVTQGSFIDKEWAADLRETLASDARQSNSQCGPCSALAQAARCAASSASREGRPRWFRIFRVALGGWIAARIRRRPPQRSHSKTSNAKALIMS